MIVLVDQDGVLADFAKGFHVAWLKHGLPDYFPNGEWHQWDLTYAIPEHQKAMADVIMSQPGFFRELPLMSGAVDGILGLLAAGHDVFICSTPVLISSVCENEKKAWIKEHFGDKLARNTVFTHDKTIIHGDILIDDKPEITGVAQPTWKHVVYDATYNRNIDKPRITWKNWSEQIK